MERTPLSITKRRITLDLKIRWEGNEGDCSQDREEWDEVQGGIAFGPGALSLYAVAGEHRGTGPANPAFGGIRIKNSELRIQTIRRSISSRCRTGLSDEKMADRLSRLPCSRVSLPANDCQ